MHAGGNVDWAIVYKKFNIVVVEVSVRSLAARLLVFHDCPALKMT